MGHGLHRRVVAVIATAFGRSVLLGLGRGDLHAACMRGRGRRARFTCEHGWAPRVVGFECARRLQQCRRRQPRASALYMRTKKECGRCCCGSGPTTTLPALHGGQAGMPSRPCEQRTATTREQAAAAPAAPAAAAAAAAAGGGRSACAGGTQHGGKRGGASHQSRTWQLPAGPASSSAARPQPTTPHRPGGQRQRALGSRRRAGQGGSRA